MDQERGKSFSVVEDSLLAQLPKFLIVLCKLMIASDLETGHKKAIHVVCVRIKPSRQRNAWMEAVLLETRETGHPEWQACLLQLDVALL